MDSNPNQIPKSEYDEIDRISDLPDSILSKILSYFPTKNAVGASILSTRWKNLSPFGVLPITVELDDSLLLHPKVNEPNSSASSSFIDFVDKLFNETLSDVPCVGEMILNCEKNYDDATIVSWVSAAVRLKVQCLSLIFALNDSMALFQSLNGCTTLVALRLSMDSELRVPDGFCLPNLKVLRLHRVKFSDEERYYINDMIKGCPALEDLSFSECNTQVLFYLYIESHVLKNLTIEGSWTESTCQLMLCVPNLEVLHYNDYAAGSYSLHEIKSLLAAHINVAPNQEQLDDIDDDDDEVQYYNNIAELVSNCSSTIRLYLSGCTIDALHHSSVQLPVFQKLTWLALGCLGVHWELLAHLLLNSPCLEKLTLEEGFEKNEEGFANFQKSLPAPPVCLDLHLKRIELWVFKEDEEEIKLIEYFLKKGKVLEILAICCLPLDDKSIIKRFRTMPRQSKSCRIAYGLKKRTHV